MGHFKVLGIFSFFFFFFFWCPEYNTYFSKIFFHFFLGQTLSTKKNQKDPFTTLGIIANRDKLMFTYSKNITSYAPFILHSARLEVRRFSWRQNRPQVAPFLQSSHYRWTANDWTRFLTVGQ